MARPQQTAVSAFPVPALVDLPEDIAARIRGIAEKTGFVPNVFLALAYRPDEFRAFFAHRDALMEREGGLTRAEREMIVVATSAANQCQYCVIAHGAILRIRAKDLLIADQIAVNWRKAQLSERERAMLRFALKVSERAQDIQQADRAALREAGFANDEIWDIAAITAFFGMSNRRVNAFNIPPNAEFYTL